MAIQLQDICKTVESFSKVTDYLVYLESIRKEKPDIDRWPVEKKKFLLVCGGTDKEREHILDYCLIILDEFTPSEKPIFTPLYSIIPSRYPITVWEKINCFDKTDNQLRGKVLYPAKLELRKFASKNEDFQYDIINYFTDPNIRETLRKKYFRKIIDILEKYKECIAKSNDYEIIPNLYRMFLDNSEKQYANLCVEFLDSDEKYARLFLMDLLDICFSIQRCDVLFLHNISSKNINVWKNIRAELLSPEPNYKFNLIFASAESMKEVEKIKEKSSFVDMFDVISLSKKEIVVTQTQVEKEDKIERTIDTEGKKLRVKKTIKLELDRPNKMVYWEGVPLSTIKGKDFMILLELAKTPGSPIANVTLYRFIDSTPNKGVLLNQRISKIRTTFPFPYGNLTNSQCIIPDGKRNKGFTLLNLTKNQVKIV